MNSSEEMILSPGSVVGEAPAADLPVAVERRRRRRRQSSRRRDESEQSLETARRKAIAVLVLAGVAVITLVGYIYWTSSEIETLRSRLNAERRASERLKTQMEEAQKSNLIRPGGILDIPLDAPGPLVIDIDQSQLANLVLRLQVPKENGSSEWDMVLRSHPDLKELGRLHERAGGDGTVVMHLSNVQPGEYEVHGRRRGESRTYRYPLRVR